LARTSFGWFDTDIYNLFMPLIIASTLAYSFKVGKSKKTPFLLLTGLLTGIHSSLWYVWWLFFYIFLGSLSLYKLLIIVYDKQRELLINIKE
jgi:asparagine N-glycosylation enzyme membrane subunit Stt3